MNPGDVKVFAVLRGLTEDEKDWLANALRRGLPLLVFPTNRGNVVVCPCPIVDEAYFAGMVKLSHSLSELDIRLFSNPDGEKVFIQAGMETLSE